MSSGISVITAGVVSVLLAWAAVGLMRHVAPRLGFIDVPNQRSSHKRPTPRAGGLGFVIVSPAVTIAVSAWAGIPMPRGLPLLILGGAVVALVGLIDDKRGLPVLARFIAYFVAASILLAGLGPIDTIEWPDGPSVQIGWLGIPLTLLWIVGLTNAYNFMDGIDGIAGTQAVVAATTMALMALVRGEPGQAAYMLPLAGGVGGFLLHNWPPARIFMGDVGSAFLGYAFAGFAVLSNSNGSAIVPFSAWVILLSPFLFDTGLTLVRRIARGERWYEAHREHLYQRLVRAGWSHRAVTVLYLVLAVYMALLVVAHFLVWIGGQVTVSILVALPLAVLVLLVRQVEARKSAARHQVAHK